LKISKSGEINPKRKRRTNKKVITSVWDRRAAYEKRHGKIKEDFSLPIREKQTWRNPLAP
jgi:hypothetical protein